MWWWWWWGRLQLKITRSVMIKHTCHATHWYIVNDSWMVGWGAVKKTFEWLNWLNVFEGIGFGWFFILQITFMRKKQKNGNNSILRNLWPMMVGNLHMCREDESRCHGTRSFTGSDTALYQTVPLCDSVWQYVTLCDTVQRQSSAFLGASWPPWCCRCSWPPVGSRSTKGELGLFFRFWTCLNCASIFRGIPKSNK